MLKVLIPMDLVFRPDLSNINCMMHCTCIELLITFHSALLLHTSVHVAGEVFYSV